MLSGGTLQCTLAWHSLGWWDAGQKLQEEERAVPDRRPTCVRISNNCPNRDQRGPCMHSAIVRQHRNRPGPTMQAPTDTPLCARAASLTSPRTRSRHGVGPMPRHDPSLYTHAGQGMRTCCTQRTHGLALLSAPSDFKNSRSDNSTGNLACVRLRNAAPQNVCMAARACTPKGRTGPTMPTRWVQACNACQFHESNGQRPAVAVPVARLL